MIPFLAAFPFFLSFLFSPLFSQTWDITTPPATTLFSWEGWCPSRGLPAEHPKAIPSWPTSSLSLSLVLQDRSLRVTSTNFRSRNENYSDLRSTRWYRSILYLVLTQCQFETFSMVERCALWFFFLRSREGNKLSLSLSRARASKFWSMRFPNSRRLQLSLDENSRQSSVSFLLENCTRDSCYLSDPSVPLLWTTANITNLRREKLEKLYNGARINDGACEYLTFCCVLDEY